MWLESVGVLSFSSLNCQEEGVSGGAKGPTVPAALRGLDAPELETKIGQMVQGGPKGSRRVLEGFSKELGWNGLAIFHHLSWVWVNTYRYIFSGLFTSMNPSYDLGFTARYQGLSPHPLIIFHHLSVYMTWVYRHWNSQKALLRIAWRKGIAMGILGVDDLSGDAPLMEAGLDSLCLGFWVQG